MEFKFKLLLFILTVLMLGGFVFPAKANAAWLAGYNHRKQITVSHTNISSTLSNFPMVVKFASDADIGGHTLSTGYDVRFTSSDGTTLLAYERESWTGGAGTSATGIFWVKVPSLSSSADTTIYMYYGNPAQSTDWTTATSTITNCTSITNAQCTWKEGVSQNFSVVFHAATGCYSDLGVTPCVDGVTVEQWNDRTANGNNLTQTTAKQRPTFKTGIINGKPVIRFTAASSNRLVSGTTFGGTSAESVTMMIINSTTSGYTSLISPYKTNLFVLNNGHWGQYLGQNVDTGISATSAATILQSSTSSYNNTIISVNGVKNTYTNGSAWYTHNPTTVGDNGSSTQYFQGDVSEIRVSNTARSADWIKFEYNNINSANNELTFATQENYLPSGWTKKAALTIDYTKVPSTQTNFPVLIGYNAVGIEKNLPTEILDSGNTNRAKSDGSDLRFSSDSAGATQLAFEIVKFTQSTTDANRKAEIWVKIPSLSSVADTTIYVWYKNSNATALSVSDAYGSQNVWSNGYAGVWHLKESTGSASNDSSAGGGGSGTNYNSPTQTAGKIGGSLNYVSASSQYTEIANSSAIDPTSQMTIGAWFYVPTLGSARAITKHSYTGKTGYAFFLDTDNKFYFQAGNGSTTWPAYNTSSSAISSTGWYYLVGVHSGSAHTLYVNGSQSGTPAGGGTISQNTHALWLSRNTDDNTYYNSQFDEVKISSTARSADWIATEYNNQSAPDTFWKTIGSPAPTATTTLKVKGNNSSASWLAGWSYRKKITISNAKVSSDLANFPLLVKLNADTLVGAKARSDGYDVRFTDADGTTILSYERESFAVASSKATGVFWVKIPTIYTSPTGTQNTLYMYYGNPAQTTDWTAATSTITNCTSITNAQCTWKEGSTQSYAGVWHLNDPTNPIDSTNNANNGTNNGVTATTGKIGGAGSFGGAQSISISNNIVAPVPVTISAWINTNNLNSGTITSKCGNFYFAHSIGSGSNGKLFWYDGSWRSSTGLISSGQWQYVAVSLNSSGVGNFFINGSASGALSNGVLGNSDGVTGLGKDGGSCGQSYFNGTMDEIRFSSTLRSADWIKFEYFNQGSTNNQINFGVQEQNATGSTTWPTGWMKKAPLTIDHTKVPSTQTNFPVLIGYNAVGTEKNLPAEILNSSSANSAKSDGSDLRFSLDSAGATQLAFEIVQFTQSATDSSRKAEIWVKIPSLSSATDTTIYVWYHNPSASALVASDTYGSQNVWTNGYAGVWHLPNGSTLSANDSTGTNNGTVTNATATAGQIDGAGSFSGSNQYITVANESNFDFERTNSFSVSLWLKSTATDAVTAIGKMLHSGNYTGWNIVVNSTNIGTYSAGAIAVQIISNWSSNKISTATTNITKLNDGSWHYYTLTYNGSSLASGIKLYEDSVSLGLTAASDNLSSSILNDYGVTIGSRANGAFAYKGKIDETRISSTLRSADWITAEYNNQSAPDTFWKTVGTTVTSGTTTLKTKGANSSTSWLSGWSYRKKITVSGAQVGSTLSYFPLLVKLNSDTVVGAKARSDGYDIRFTDSDGTTVLPYERETYSVASSKATAVFWVRVPSITTSGATLYMYYGKSSASTDWNTDNSVTTNCTSPQLTNAQCTWKENASQNFNGIIHLKDGSTLSVSDSTGTLTTSNNSATAATGKVDGSAGLNGSQYISGGTVTPPNAITWEGWANISALSTSASAMIISNTVASPRYGTSLYLYNNAGTITIRFEVDDNNESGYYQYSAQTPSPAISTGVWYHIIVTQSTPTSAPVIYLNGVSQSLTALFTTGSPARASGTLAFGRYGANSSSYLSGSIDELRMSNAVRSADWIKFEYHNMNSTNNQLTWNAQEQSTTSTLKSTAR